MLSETPLSIASRKLLENNIIKSNLFANLKSHLYLSLYLT